MRSALPRRPGWENESLLGREAAIEAAREGGREGGSEGGKTRARRSHACVRGARWKGGRAARRGLRGAGWEGEEGQREAGTHTGWFEVVDSWGVLTAAGGAARGLCFGVVLLTMMRRSSIRTAVRGVSAFGGYRRGES